MNMVSHFTRFLMKRLFPVLALFTLYAGFFTASCQQQSEHRIPMVLPPLPEPEPEPTFTTVRITAFGDLMCHSPQFKYAKVGKDSFDFRPWFEYVKPMLESADFTIGNIETTFSGGRKAYSGYPNFNSPVAYLEAIKDAGVDFLVSANNHTMDTGEKGVQSTIKALDELGFGRTGSYTSKADRDSIRVVDIEGITMAIVNYTYGMNGYQCPEGKPWMVNMIDSTLIKADIAAAKALEPDLVCVFYHYGAEYIHEPDAFQRECVEIAQRSGADLILGAHPHVVQPMEYFATQGGNIDTGIVVYSMGNFISNQGQRYRDAGIIVNLELTKDLQTEKVSLTDVSYLPTWVFRGNHPKRKPHGIIPSEMSLQEELGLDFVDAKGKTKMATAFADVNKYATLYAPIRRVEMKDYLPAEPDRILFHSGMCFGSCPDYSLSVNEAGQMELWGGQFSNKCGFYQAQVPDSLLEAVQSLFNREAWMQLKDAYKASFTDASTYSTLYVQEGRIVKNIKDYGAAGPAALKQVYQTLRRLYEADIWTPMEASYFTCMALPPNQYKTEGFTFNLNKVETFFLWQSLNQAGGTMEPAFELAMGTDPHYPYQGSRYTLDAFRQPNCLLNGHPFQSAETNGQSFDLLFEEDHHLKVNLGYPFFEENSIRTRLPDD